MKTNDKISQLLKNAMEKVETLTKGDSDKDFHNTLETHNMNLERCLSAFAHFNFQCWNNGLRNWFTNGYCLDIDELIKSVQLIDTVEANRLIELLKTYSSKIDFDREPRGYCSDCYLLKTMCYECGGTGKVEIEIDNNDYCVYCEGSDPECEDCNGNGESEQYKYDEVECTECDGEGEYSDCNFFVSTEDECWELTEIVRKQLNHFLTN